jgi:cyclic dehypoxanthinyl futalosine synthase
VTNRRCTPRTTHLRHRPQHQLHQRLHAKCTFCAFRRDHEDADSYTLSYDQIGDKIRELVAIGGTQVLMQGGMNDRLPIEWYEGLAAGNIKTNFPDR